MPDPRLTVVQHRVVHALRAGEVLTDDAGGLRLEPSGTPVNRRTLRALLRDGVVVDPGAPLFNPLTAGRLTAHGRTLGETST